ncbi:hypothetical protein [Sphaerisporangium dianthi]|uniref:Uncharacterized protein n=1 Tax=Sphaerisporangium dianthi TaxID=1436120 RepID=A0ABV9CPQ8_9ACTN
MSDPNGGNDFLYGLEAEVEVELTLAEASRPEEEMGRPVSEWLFDPTDAEREEIGLRGLLDAVVALEDDSRPGDHGA